MVPMVAKIVHCKPSLWDRSCCSSVVRWSLGDSLGQSNSVIECDGGTGVWSFLPSAGLPTGLPETFLEVHHSQRLFFPNVPSCPTLFSYVSDLYRPLTVFTWLLLLSLPFIFHKHYLPNFSCTSSSILFCFPEDLYLTPFLMNFSRARYGGTCENYLPTCKDDAPIHYNVLQ